MFPRNTGRIAVLRNAAALAITASTCLSVLAGVPGWCEAASAAPASPACHLLDPPSPGGKIATTRVLGPTAIGSISATGGRLAVAEPALARVAVLDPDGGNTNYTPIASADLKQAGAVMDASGALYVLHGPFSVVKYDSAGRQVWSYTNAKPLRGLFIQGLGLTSRVGATLRDSPTAITLTTSGAVSGPPLAMSGDGFSTTADGGIAAIDAGRYVRTYDSSGKLLSLVGDQEVDNDASPSGAPMHFYQLGGAARLPDGRLLVTDTQRGIMVLSAEGLLLGAVSPTQLDTAGLTQRSNIAIVGNSVFLATGARFTSAQYLTRVSLADVLSHATHGESAGDPRLGIGAGLVTGVPDNYFPAGRPVTVRAAFDPWWQSVAQDMQLCWSMRNQDDLYQGKPGESGVLPSASWTYGSAGTPLALPPDLAPGVYKLDAQLLKAGTPVSSTELIVTVAAAGQHLDLATLPTGADWGGPSPARGVAISDELGTKVFRAQLDWSRLLSAGTAAPLTFTYYDAPFAAAAAEAQRRGATFIVQIGQGGPEKQLVANGTWSARVAEVVRHFNGVVHTWEVWNEPNVTYGAAADYVSKVLAPAYRAVKTVDPSATVIGGSVVGTSLPYWQGIVQAGGLQYMDVAGIHPYTGHNRSWEEQGTISQLRALKSLLVRDGHPLPIWITELAWWSDGAANLLTQADNSARALLWMADIGIDKWAYFLPEAGWGNNGVSFSAIQVNDFVKPSALALMTTTAQIAGRPFLGEVSLGMPSTYALRFGPRTTDPSSGELLVAWTDGVTMPAVLTGDHANLSLTTTEVLGASKGGTLSAPTPIALTGSPVFLEVNGGGHLTITPQEGFATNLAQASQGTTAAASSVQAANPVGGAIDGDSGAANGGDLPGLPDWVSAPGDAHPQLTVSLRAPQVIDRAIVSTHSIGSIVPGLRDYNVEVRASRTGPWTTVAAVRGQFYERQTLVHFPAQVVSDIRVDVVGVNLTGVNEDGTHPPYWRTDAAGLGDARSAWYGPAVISEVAMYAPGALAISANSPGATAPSASPAGAATSSASVPMTVTASAPAAKLQGSVLRVAAIVRSGGRGIGDRTVQLLRGGSVVASSRSGPAGTTALTAAVTRTASYSVRAVGDAAYQGASSKAFVVVVQRRTATTLALSSSKVRKGAVVLARGRVVWAGSAAPLHRVRVELWAYASGRWSRKDARSTDTGGRVTFRVKPTRSVRYQLRFRGSGQIASYLPIASASRAVQVRIS